MNDVWEKITKDELRRLAEKFPDSMIAKRYGVTVHQVSYKRKKFGIIMKNLAYQKALAITKRHHIKSISAKDWLLDKENIDPIAKALTQYAFRSGPVEDMHAVGKLTNDDMKLLNQYMANRLAGLLQKAFDGEWEQIADIFDYYITLCSGWDKAVPDTTDFRVLKSHSGEGRTTDV